MFVELVLQIMIIGTAFQKAMIVGLTINQSMIVGLAFQQAMKVVLTLWQSMTVGMAFQWGMILRLVLTTSYDYRYGLSAGHDCRTGFRASRDISFHGPVYIHNHLLVLLTVTPGL